MGHNNQPISVLIADDGSEHSQAARQLVCDLPLPAISNISLVSVVSSKKDSDLASLAEGMEEVENQFHKKGFKVETDLLVGNPAKTLDDFAEKKKVDFLAIGAGGLRATFGIFLGGIVQKVVERSRRPVLIVKAPYQELRLVLVVADGSPHSRFAVNNFARFPLPEETEVRLVYVFTPFVYPEFNLCRWPEGVEPLQPYDRKEREDIAARQAEEERNGQELLNKNLQLLASSGIKASGILLCGDPVSEIIRYAKANQADLIVAGSRSMSQVRGWLLSSLSRKLIYYSNCSLLIYRGQKQT